MNKKEIEKDEKMGVKNKYQQEINLLFEEKKIIEDEIKNINLLIQEKEVELKKINEKKYQYNVEREKIEKKEKTSILLEERREIEKNRWEIEKEIADIIDIELKIGEIVFEKRTQLKEINIQYNLLKEKILKIEEKLVLINNQIQDIDKTQDKIQKEEMVKKQGEKTKEEERMVEFFELFYQKIWLSVVIFDDNEKKAFKTIILSGGADFIPKMAEYIQKKINQKFTNVIVKIADPFVNIDDSSLLKRPKKISQFSNAIGAALKGFKN